MADSALVRRLLGGEEVAFDEFFTEYLRRVYRFALARVDGDADSAEEMAQISLSKALEKLHTYRREAALFTWICAICRREIAAFREREGRPEVPLLEDDPATRAALDVLAAAAGNDPESQLRRRELTRLVQATLDHLPGQYGDALEWRYAHGLGVDEIAAKLGVGYKAAESLLSRAQRVSRELQAMLNDDEETVARLIRLTGARPSVPLERQLRARDELRSIWQRANRRRAAWRRTVAATGVLSAAALIMIGARLWIGRDSAIRSAPADEFVATVERVDRHAGHGVGQNIHAGATIETPSSGRLALRLTDRTSLRLDADTRVRLASAGSIELAAGAIYIDAGAASTGIEIHTSFGVVRDVGTQFEVRLVSAALRISVRSGRVELQSRSRQGGRSPSELLSVGPGGQLTVGDKGHETSTVPSSGALWSWTASLSPPFNIEGQPLASFLDHLAREHGWVIRYEDAQLARDASGIILHGSIAGLGPEDSLAVTLRTSGLSHRLTDGEVVISRAAQRR